MALATAHIDKAGPTLYPPNPSGSSSPDNRCSPAVPFKRFSTSSGSSTSVSTTNNQADWGKPLYLRREITYNNIAVPSLASLTNLEENSGGPPGPRERLNSTFPVPDQAPVDVESQAAREAQQHQDPSTMDDILSTFAQIMTFGLSGVYLSRINRIFLEAELGLGDIKEMVCQTGGDHAQREALYHLHETADHSKLPRFKTLLQMWDSFVDSTLREWKALNVASTLLLTAILTLLQIPGLGDCRPIRYTALVALKCSLMSIIFGITFVVKFSSMRRRYMASEWALEARKLRTPFFDVWHLLALPAVWLAWSMCIFILVIQLCIWREHIDERPRSALQVLAWSSKVVASGLLIIGMIYFGILIQHFRHWGQNVEEDWKMRIDQYYKDMEGVSSRHPSRSSTGSTAPAPGDVPISINLPTPPESASTTPKVTLVPPTPRYATPSHSCPDLTVSQSLYDNSPAAPHFGDLEPLNSLRLQNASPKRKLYGPTGEAKSLQTDTPLSPLVYPAAGGLIPESHLSCNTLDKPSTQDGPQKKGRVKSLPSRSTSVDTYTFAPHQASRPDENVASTSQTRVRRTQGNRYAPLSEDVVAPSAETP